MDPGFLLDGSGGITIRGGGVIDSIIVLFIRQCIQVVVMKPLSISHIFTTTGDIMPSIILHGV